MAFFIKFSNNNEKNYGWLVDLAVWPETFSEQRVLCLNQQIQQTMVFHWNGVFIPSNIVMTIPQQGPPIKATPTQKPRDQYCKLLMNLLIFQSHFNIHRYVTRVENSPPLLVLGSPDRIPMRSPKVTKVSRTSKKNTNPSEKNAKIDNPKKNGEKLQRVIFTTVSFKGRRIPCRHDTW